MCVYAYNDRVICLSIWTLLRAPANVQRYEQEGTGRNRDIVKRRHLLISDHDDNENQFGVAVDVTAFFCMSRPTR